jgi:hypothetical protein
MTHNEQSAFPAADAAPRIEDLVQLGRGADQEMYRVPVHRSDLILQTGRTRGAGSEGRPHAERTADVAYD